MACAVDGNVRCSLNINNCLLYTWVASLPQANFPDNVHCLVSIPVSECVWGAYNWKRPTTSEYISYSTIRYTAVVGLFPNLWWGDEI